ncbi:hypothetical protein D3C72_2072390 [compost metagenome]
MAIDRQVQPAGAAGGQTLQIAFRRTDAGQDFVGQRQHAQAGGGEPGRPRAAVQ